MATNIEITEQLNELIKNQNKLLDSQAKIMKGQLASMKAIADTFGKISGEKLSKSFNELDKTIKSADENLEKFGKTGNKQISDLDKAFTQASMGSKKFSGEIGFLGTKLIKFGVYASILENFFDGFKVGTSILSSFVSVGFDIVGVLGNIASSILAIPFKILNAFISQSTSGGTGLFEQMEAVRDSFGSLAKNEGKAVIQTFRNIKGELGTTGLFAYRVLGNFAERLQAMREFAEALGTQFSFFKDELAKNAEQAVVYQKGLGLTNETLQAVAKRARTLGEDFTELGRHITTLTVGMSKRFGISQKLISKDVAEMAGDFENFGSLGVQTMTQVAVYTRKLGLAVKDLLGLVDKFDTFESAAESAAQLSQAFNVQIDVLDMVREQDPAKRFDNLRKAFTATGRSVENLSRQELKLLSQQTGLSAEAIKLGLANKNQSLSYEDVQKQAELTEKKQLSQADAMKELADSIRVLVKSGQQIQGGFFDHFIAGFDQGIRMSRDFRIVMFDIQRALRGMVAVGRRVGLMFVQMFPGIKDVLGGLRAFFDPKEFGRVLRGGGIQGGTVLGKIRDDFKQFFQDLTKNPKVALSSLFENLRKTFFSHFDKNAPGGMKILGGFKKFFSIMFDIIGAGFQLAAEGLVRTVPTIFDKIRDWFNGPGGKALVGTIKDVAFKLIDTIDKTLPIVLKSLTSFIEDITAALKGEKLSKNLGKSGSWLSEIFSKAIESFKKNWQPLLSALGSAIFELIKVTISKISPKVWLTVGAILFGPSLAFSLIAALTGVLLKSFLNLAAPLFVKFGKSFAGGMFGGIEKALGSAGAKGIGSMGTTKIAKSVKGIGESLTDVAKNSTKFGIRDAVELTKKFAAMGVALSVGGLAVAGGLVVIKKVLNAGGLKSPRDIKMPLIVLGTAVVAFIGLSASMKLISALPNVSQFAEKIVAGLAAIAVISTAMALNFRLILLILKNVTQKQVDVAMSAMSAMGKMYLMAGGVILGSAGLGAILIGTGGLALAPILAGLAALTAVVTAMAANTIVIMKKLNEFKPDANFISKTKAFTDIMAGTTAFAQVILDILETSKPSFGGLLSFFAGKDPQEEFNNTLGLVDKIINQIQVNLVGIISSIASTLSNVDPAKLQAGMMIGTFLQSTAEFIKALIPPPELEPSFLGKLFGKSSLENLNQFIKDMTSSLIGDGGNTGLITHLKNIFLRLSTMGAVNVNAIDAFSKYIGATAELVNTFKDIKPEQLEKTGMLAAGFSNSVIMPLADSIPYLVSTTDALAGQLDLLERSFIGKTASGLRSVVKEINEVSAALMKLKPIKVSTQLKAMADKMGLTGNEEIRLAERNIVLNVNVGVKIDAAELEKVLLDRPRSQFVKRRD